MKEIDFLPTEYREKNAVHRARLCQIAVIVCFGSLIALATCYQVATYRSASHELASLTEQYKEALVHTNEMAVLRKEVEKNRQFAELYTYLNYPWPRTQLLAEIINKLPDTVKLNELTIVKETPQVAPRGRLLAGKVATATELKIPPAQADLATLRLEQDQIRPVIQISGTTTDPGQLHLFVMSLNDTPLFETAKVHSMEAVPKSEQTKSFFVRLSVRPGYGQPEGPKVPPTVAVQAHTERSVDRS